MKRTVDWYQSHLSYVEGAQIHIVLLSMYVLRMLAPNQETTSSCESRAMY